MNSEDLGNPTVVITNSNGTPKIVKCPKCRRNFNTGNYEGHRKYEETIENAEIKITKITSGEKLIAAQTGIVDSYMKKYIENAPDDNPTSGNIPVDKVSLAALKSMVDKVSDTIVTQEMKCNICFNKFKSGEYIITLPMCFHSYHDSHLFEFLHLNNFCPLCKMEITKELEFNC